MNEIDATKHTIKTLEFIFDESDKYLSSISNSITQNSNRSFFVCALYLSVVSFSFTKLISLEYEYIPLMIGSIISCFVIRENLMPTIKEIRGASPKDMINEYFDHFKDQELEKEYLATQIQSYNMSIELNKKLINKMTKRYTRSFYTLIASAFIFAITFFTLHIYSI